MDINTLGNSKEVESFKYFIIMLRENMQKIWNSLESRRFRIAGIFYQLYPPSNLLFANRRTDVLLIRERDEVHEPAAVGLPLPDKLVAASDRDITFPAKFTVIPAQRRATYNTQNT